MRGGKAPTAMIDSLNHRSGPPSDVPYNRLTDSFELYAGKDVEAGEECFLSYGRHSNDAECWALMQVNFLCSQFWRTENHGKQEIVFPGKQWKSVKTTRVFFF